MKEQLVWSDVWILLAIIYSSDNKEQSADLPSIIRAADYINHAIPTDDEIIGASHRLKQAGLIEDDGGRFKASASAMKIYTQVRKPRSSVHKEFESLQRLLTFEMNES